MKKELASLEHVKGFPFLKEEILDLKDEISDRQEIIRKKFEEIQRELKKISSLNEELTDRYCLLYK